MQLKLYFPEDPKLFVGFEVRELASGATFGCKRKKNKQKKKKTSLTELCGISPCQIIPGISASRFYFRKQEA